MIRAFYYSGSGFIVKIGNRVVSAHVHS